MEQLLKQAQDLVTALNNELNEAKAKQAELNASAAKFRIERKAELNASAAKFRIERKAFDEHVASLEAREAVVLSSEAAVDALKESKRIRSDVKEAQERLDLATETFHKEVAEAKKETSKAMAELAQAQAEVVREREDFKRLKAELVEKEKTMKDRILTELKAKL